jgi:putrescine transport system substrate-binding protein
MACGIGWGCDLKFVRTDKKEDMMKKFLIAMGLAIASIVPAGAQELRVYNWSDYIAEDTIEKFTKETGIKVTYDVYDSNEVLEAKLLAGSSGYDIVVPTSEFLQRQIAAGVYQPLDKSKLPNLKNMDEGLMKAASQYDPDNKHAIIYMWGTTGIGYNVDKIKERLGADAKIDSWALIFDPAQAAKVADCGITLLDSPSDILPHALKYLKLPTDSTKEADLKKAAELIKSVRKNIRYFHSSQYINDLANGDVCVSVGFSGDIFIAAGRASEANKGVTIEYVIPKEGALQWFDMMAIPKDAPNADAAHKFINFIMEPQITADITNFVSYASANKAAMPLIQEDIRTNPAIFPTPDVMANLWTNKVKDAKVDRVITRLWTEVKTGQ